MEFRDAAGATVLTYAGLKVWDADGKILASRFVPADSPLLLRLLVDERGARYPLTIDPIAQQAYIKASNTGANDNFGFSVAVSGETVVIGAPGEDSSTNGVNGTPNEDATDSGAAYVFVRSSTGWTQQAWLKPATVGSTQAGDEFGYSVAISGDRVVVGAWREDSGTTGVNIAPDESAVSAGAAYVFVRSRTGWTQQAYLKPSAVGTSQVGDSFGTSVAVSGDTIVIGAPYEDSSTTGVNTTPNENANAAGAAYVFTRSGTTWIQQAYLKPADADVGIWQAGDSFGSSVAISGDTVVVGAFQAGGNFTYGAASIFVRSGTTWTQQAWLQPADVDKVDGFGFSVGVSGDTVVVGSPYEDSSSTGVNSTPNESAPDAGAAYVFLRSGTTWTQEAYLKPAAVGTSQVLDKFGRAVAVSGDTVVIGARQESSSTTGVNSTPNENAGWAGAAYVFTRSGTSWTQHAYLKPAAIGTTQMGDEFGYSVAVSGDTVVVGALQEGSSTTGVNSPPNEGAGGSGAAYMFIQLPVVDIGLRVYDGNKIINIAAEPPGTLTSPLRIWKNGTAYGIVLTDVNSPDASKMRVQTSSGVKALQKLP